MTEAGSQLSQQQAMAGATWRQHGTGTASLDPVPNLTMRRPGMTKRPHPPLSNRRAHSRGRDRRDPPPQR